MTSFEVTCEVAACAVACERALLFDWLERARLSVLSVSAENREKVTAAADSGSNGCTVSGEALLEAVAPVEPVTPVVVEADEDKAAAQIVAEQYAEAAKKAEMLAIELVNRPGSPRSRPKQRPATQHAR